MRGHTSMLFQYTLPQVLAGEKTMTRRLIAPNDTSVEDANGHIQAILSNGRDKFRVGKTYAVQPARGKPQVARIEVLRLGRGSASSISEQDARAEGFPSREAFLNEWHKIHGDAKMNADVWVIEFRLVEPSPPASPQ
jgi:ASCH domain-containing protein